MGKFSSKIKLEFQILNHTVYKYNIMRKCWSFYKRKGCIKRYFLVPTKVAFNKFVI